MPPHRWSVLLAMANKFDADTILCAAPFPRVMSMRPISEPIRPASVSLFVRGYDYGTSVLLHLSGRSINTAPRLTLYSRFEQRLLVAAECQQVSAQPMQLRTSRILSAGRERTV